MKSVRDVLFFVSIISLFIVACGEPKDKTSLRKVHWDRDMCERCKMVTSDRHHSVQVIDPANGRHYMFDDIGCTVLWFEEEKIPWKDKAKIWITDVKTGKWIDAKTAFYDSKNISPMAYGFAAHESKESIKKGEKIYRYDDLYDMIYKIEQRLNSKNYTNTGASK